MEDGNNKKRKLNGAKNGGGGGGFHSLGLSPLVTRNIQNRLGFRTPTPVQRRALPVILSGVDTVVMARTGSGKTAAFCIPLVEAILQYRESAGAAAAATATAVKGVILSPTRELSLQTLRVFQRLANEANIRSIGIHGGEGMEHQFHLLASQPDVIVATPGRLAHHLTEIPDFDLGHCLMFILDEADRLLEMGFSVQIRQIAKTLPSLNASSCQKVLLSATMPKALVEFTRGGFAVDPTMVRLDQEATVSEDLRIAFLTCRSQEKDAALMHVLSHIQQDLKRFQKDSEASKKNNNTAANGNEPLMNKTGTQRTGLTLIFAATRHHVEYIATLLESNHLECTMIYGTLDPEARRLNLAAFRAGRKPILVVTDVAARGIDVPLIDHVIHYHFPPNPKLFVHRSGRAARAGRIGFCWGLVEPDEMPYMMDLHLFLGRKPAASRVADNEEVTGGSGSNTIQKHISYTLDEMTPDMVHYGSVPELIMGVEIEKVQRLLHPELSGSQQAESLRSLVKVCNNALKQYRRTRAEASREAVRRAKSILDGERAESGQRVAAGVIPPHPLLVHLDAAEDTENKEGLATAQNLRDRQDFLRALSNFRPKESVFEAFATGGNKEAAVTSQVDKGRTTAGGTGRRQDSSAALVAMKNMRRQMRMVRDKGATLVVAGSEQALELNNEIKGSKNSNADNDGADGVEEEHTSTNVPSLLMETGNPVVENKRRMSKAERKRQKKNLEDTQSKGANVQDPSALKKKKNMSGGDFRDPTFFISNDATSGGMSPEEAHRARQVEAAMQPSASSASGNKGSIIGRALRMEEAMLDIVGDEHEEFIQKQRMMRWDTSKRKYVQTTVGAELSGDSKSKRMRLESGQRVKSDKMKLGELYAKWQKKTNRSVGRTGIFDDNHAGGGGDNIDESAKNASGQGGESSDNGKTAHQIKKDRERKEKLKIKNMKKSDRRVLLRKQQAEWDAKQQQKQKQQAFGKRGKRKR